MVRCPFPRVSAAAVFALLTLLAMLAALAPADTVRLKNGNVVTGRIVEENENDVRIDTGQITLTFQKKNIASVAKGLSTDYLLAQGQRALTDGQKLLQQGDTLKARHTFETALQEIESGLQELPSPPQSLLDLKERLDKARVDTLPKDATNQKAEELYRQALAHLDHLDYSQAFDVLQQAAKLVPDRADILLRLAETARHVNEDDRAIEAYQTVLSVDPESFYSQTAAPLLKLRVQRVQKALAEHRMDKAVDAYEEVLLLAGPTLDKTASLKEYLARKSARKTESKEDLLMEVFRHADNNDLIDLAYAAIKDVQALKPKDASVKRLVDETAFLTQFKARIDAGKVEDASALVVGASPEVIGSKRVAEKMKKIAGDLAPKIEAKTLLAQAKSAFEAGQYKKALTFSQTLSRKYPDSDSAAAVGDLLKNADFEATVQESLDAATHSIDHGQYDAAEKEFRELLQYDNIKDSLQYSRLEALQKRVPRERAADRLWEQAGTDLEKNQFQSALRSLEKLVDTYAETRAGRSAKKWLAEYRKRLDREIARYKPKDSDFFVALADPVAWCVPVAGTNGSPAGAPDQPTLKVGAVPQDKRILAWRTFDKIMAIDLAGKVDPRSHWLHLGLPIVVGVLFLFGFLWFFGRPGSGKHIHMEDSKEPDEPGHPGKPETLSGSTCRMCGLPVRPDTPACPSCGTPPSLTAIEAERARDDSRLANLDPWDIRTRARNINDFEPHFEKARQFAEQGVVSAAVESCRRALHEDPHSASAYSFLAELYERQGHTAEAQACYREILLLNPAEVVVRRKIRSLATFADIPLQPGPVVIILSAANWWFLFWVLQGLDPGEWLMRIPLAIVGAALTALLWNRANRYRKIPVPAPHHHGAEKTTPLPPTTLSWREQNRQARFMAQLVEEHTGIQVPALTVWRFVFALIGSLLLLAALVGIAWFNREPLVLLAWPAGFLLFLYLFEVHPRVVTAHVLLRHLFEETFSPWVDPHRPFRPGKMKDRVTGEFLLSALGRLPVRWAWFPFPYKKTRQGLLNSLQQALNRHWEFHRFYPNLRVVRDTEVPMPAGFRFAGWLVVAFLCASVAGMISAGAIQYENRERYHEDMTIGYQSLLEGNLAVARGHFQSAARQDPDRAAPLMYLADTEAAAGFDFAAERAFHAAALRARRIPQVYNDFGNFLQKEGRLRQALAEFTIALKDDPNNADILNNIGSAHFKLKDYAKAVDFLLPAVKANPNHRRAYTTLGLALEAMGDKDRARKAYENAVRVAPDQPFTQVARTRLDLNLRPEEKTPLRLGDLSDGSSENNSITAGAPRSPNAGNQGEAPATKPNS